MIDIEKLKALAEAANVRTSNAEADEVAMFSFECAFNPAAVLDLIAQIERLSDSTLPERIDQIKAENEALRRDAERYRWLRDDAVDPGTVIDKKVGVFNSEDGGYPIWEYRAGEELDCAIDAAMSKEKP